MNKKHSVLLLSTLAVASIGVHAEESIIPNVDIAAGATLTSNYIWRGVTQTDNGPAIQGNFDISASMFYAGAWASNVDFVDGVGEKATSEHNYYVGLNHDYGDFNFDLGWLRYYYPKADNLNWSEYHLAVAYAPHSANYSVQVGAHITDEVFGSNDDGRYYVINLGYDVPKEMIGGVDGLSLSGHFGHYDLSGSTFGSQDYNDYGLGISKSVSEHISVGLNWTNTNDDFTPATSTDDDSKVAISISAEI